MQKRADFDFNTGGKLPDLRRYSSVRLQRNPAADEKEMIDENESNWLPKIIKTPGDPLAEDLASPTKQALLHAVAAGSIGAGLGGVAGKVIGGDEGMKIGAGLGGLSTAALAAMLAYYNRIVKNAEIKDRLLRLPPKATRRDLELNPVYQMETDLDQLRRTAMLNAAMRGSFREQNYQQSKTEREE
jgi:hypothetical protein